MILLSWMYLVVLWLTWTPTGTAPVEILLLPPSMSSRVVVGNLALFAPMGLVLGTALAKAPARAPTGSSRGPDLRAVLLGGLGVAVLSLVVELGQLWVPGRSTSPYDVGLNALGGLGAAWIGVRLARRGTDPVALQVGAGGVVLLGVAIFLSATGFAVASGLRILEWDPTYPVVAGAEPDGERPYRGRVTEAWICSGEEGAEVCAEPGAPGAVRSALATGAARSQEVILSASVVSDGPQTGPARIITYSQGWWTRNAMLGQQDRDLVLRLRTPLAGVNGAVVQFVLPGAVSDQSPTELRAAFRQDRIVLSARSASEQVRGEFRWGTLSGWWLTSGRAGRDVTPSDLRRATVVGAAAFGVPLGLALIWFGSGPLALLALAGAATPPGALTGMGLALGIPLPAMDLVVSAGFGGLGVALGLLVRRFKPEVGAHTVPDGWAHPNETP